MLPPSAFTVRVPFARLLDIAMLGYGTGRLFGGVLHTSGMVAMETPELPLCTRLNPLTLIVTDMVSWLMASVDGAAQRRASARLHCYSTQAGQPLRRTRAPTRPAAWSPPGAPTRPPRHPNTRPAR